MSGTRLRGSWGRAAALLAGAAWRLAPTAQARYSLLQSLAQPVRGILTASSGVVTALAYSPDGTTLAAGYSGGAIRLWDLASHRAISATSWGAAPLALAFTGGNVTAEVEVAGALLLAGMVFVLVARRRGRVRVPSGAGRRARD